MADDTLKKRTLFRHPLAAVGGALVLAGGFLFIVLLLIDFAAGGENPYQALTTFVMAPAIATLGAVLFLIAAYIQISGARKKGEKVKFNLRIDSSDPTYMRSLWIFLSLGAVMIVIVAYSSYRAYEATDSVAFCSDVCHTVMEPQAVTYKNSPHARVPCVDCHIGPGASFYVRSKLDGTRQLFRTALNSYERPIQTPVTNLRPAQETCEGCHWPKQFYGQKLVSHTYYRTDETNSPWTIDLLVKIGGGNPRTGKLEGIHWHMLADNKVSYVAADRKRQQIAWVKLIRSNGEIVNFRNPDLEMPDTTLPENEVRSFDCMDCHNRPSHRFLAPAMALNLALATRNISPQLPYIRQVGLDLLNATYENREEAAQKISAGLKDYYQANYPDVVAPMAQELAQAEQYLLTIYHDNFFPEMKTDYRARENNLSHFVNDGCFRCHNNTMVGDNGEKIASDCKTCHLIVAQGPSENIDSLEQSIAGLEFRHPEDIDDAWKEGKCTDCHTPEQGY